MDNIKKEEKCFSYKKGGHIKKQWALFKECIEEKVIYFYLFCYQSNMSHVNIDI